MMGKNIVLFVDDEAEILNSIKRAAIDEDFVSLFASSAQEALGILKEHEVSVLVTDMRMPDMDGLSLLKEAKLNYPDMLRIVLSGQALLDLEQVLSAINHGEIFRFVTKPWRMKEDLFAVVWRGIEYYNLRRDKQRLERSLEQRNAAYKNMLRRLEEKISEKKDLLDHIKRFFIQILAGCTTEKSGETMKMHVVCKIIEDFFKTLPAVYEEFTLKEVIWSVHKYIHENTSNIQFEQAVHKPEIRCYGNANLLTMILVTVAKLLKDSPVQKMFKFSISSQVYQEKKIVRLNNVVELGHVPGVNVPALDNEVLTHHNIEYFISLLAHIGRLAGVLVTYTYLNQNTAMISIEADFPMVIYEE